MSDCKETCAGLRAELADLKAKMKEQENDLDRWWSKILVNLCQSAGVDPATLEDGPEHLRDEIVKMRAEVEHLRKQRDWLQESNTALLMRARQAETHAKWMSEEMPMARAADVAAFFNAVGDGDHVGRIPRVPPVESLRLGLRLFVEEAGETVLACFGVDSLAAAVIRDSIATIQHWIGCVSELNVDLPALADGTVDTDYVSRGLLLRCGIDDAPLWRAVHAANMTKANGPRDPVTGKKLKPEGFVPPDIAGELRKQGWQS